MGLSRLSLLYSFTWVGKRLGKNSDELEMTKQTEAAAYRERGQVFGRRVDVSAEVKLIDLSEGDDVDPLNVTAAHLKVVIEIWSFFFAKERGTVDIKLCKKVTRWDISRELSGIKAFPVWPERLEGLLFPEEFKL